MSQLDLFSAPPPLTRGEAIALLAPYLDQDVRIIADQLGVTQPGTVPKNRGWVGHTVEWLLGQAPNNQQSPDFGSWELKTIQVRPHRQDQIWTPGGALSLTHFQPQKLVETSFEESHLYAKIQHLLLACHATDGDQSPIVRLVKLCEYDLTDETLAVVRTEYQGLQWALSTHGVMGLREVTNHLLGAQADGKQWRFVFTSSVPAGKAPQSGLLNRGALDCEAGFCVVHSVTRGRLVAQPLLLPVNATM